MTKRFSESQRRTIRNVKNQPRAIKSPDLAKLHAVHIKPDRGTGYVVFSKTFEGMEELRKRETDKANEKFRRLFKTFLK